MVKPDDEKRMQEWLDLRAKNPGTYVMPYAAPVRPSDKVVHVPQVDINLPHQVQVVSNNTYEDRAVHFVIITNCMGWIVALFVVGLLYVAWDWPLLAGATLLAGLGMYLATWLVAFIIHHLLLPDFTVLFNAVMLWFWLWRR